MKIVYICKKKIKNWYRCKNNLQNINILLEKNGLHETTWTSKRIEQENKLINCYKGRALIIVYKHHRKNHRPFGLFLCFLASISVELLPEDFDILLAHLLVVVLGFADVLAQSVPRGLNRRQLVGLQLPLETEIRIGYLARALHRIQAIRIWQFGAGHRVRDNYGHTARNACQAKQYKQTELSCGWLISKQNKIFTNGLGHFRSLAF